MTEAANHLPMLMFDRGKPFYPLVTNYLVQLAGWVNITARGVVGPPDLIPFLKDLDARGKAASEPNAAQNLAIIEERLLKMRGPLDLRCESHVDRIKLDIDELAGELVNNHLYVLRFSMRAAGNLLILAHEICKDEPYHDKGPLWEFLRHCRNAAAHGGRFKFMATEPRRIASWRQFHIEATLGGTLLFKDENGDGLLSPGDPVLLLWDIEQAYPDMTCAADSV